MPSTTGFREDIGSNLIAQARGMRPLLLRHAPDAEKNGRLAGEVVEALQAAGMFKVGVPRRWDGLCLSASDMALMALELAKGCPSTAWVVCISNSNAWVASLGPDRLQEAVFANGVPITCGAVNPPGRFEKVEGGFIVNGAWPYSSGSLHSSWGMFGLGSRDEHGHFVPGGAFFIPMSEVTIEETWHVAGLKATGSNTVVAKDLFVPAHLHVPPAPPGGPHPGVKHKGEASDFFPLLPHLRSVMLGVLVGMAEAVLEGIASGAKHKGIVYTTYTRQADSHVAQKEIGEAAAMIRAARLLMAQATKEVDDVALSGAPMAYLEQCQNRGQTALATDLLVKAVDKLMNIGGSGAFMEKNDLQRYWRDLGVAARHAAMVPQVGFEIYGRSLTGIEPNIAPHPAFI